MGFEETFTAYLVGKDLINKSFHFEYNRLKNDLNFCRHHRHNEASVDSHGDDFNQTQCHSKLLVSFLLFGLTVFHYHELLNDCSHA